MVHLVTMYSSILIDFSQYIMVRLRILADQNKRKRKELILLLIITIILIIIIIIIIIMVYYRFQQLRGSSSVKILI